MKPLQNLFICGCYRSGTTLLEKLLHCHPRITIASQPFPVLYAAVKQVFLDERGLKRRYPLEHLFDEKDYRPEDFCDFLGSYRLNESFLSQFTTELHAYKTGLWTPEILDYLSQLRSGKFYDVYQQLLETIVEIFPKENLAYSGSKEILCEEYIPFLLQQGVKVIHILRDPRDLIASVNFKQRDNQTGDIRPTLYSLRLWRKSAAYAIYYANHPLFLSVRYEDVVNDPQTVFEKIAEFLGVESWSECFWENPIFDQRQNIWRGNSSFKDCDGLEGNTRKRVVLPENTQKYVENCCLPEMLWHGCTIDDRFNPTAINNFVEPIPVTHQRFRSDYSLDDDRIRLELRRIELLLNTNDLSTPTEEILAMFLYRNNFDRLRDVLKKNRKVEINK